MFGTVIRRGLGRGRRGLVRLGVILAMTSAVSGMAMRPAAAQIGSDRYASMVMDAASGAVLSAVNPDDPRYPASLTKMMTLYMAFEALRDRRVSRDELVPVSMHAAMMVPSKLGLEPGTRLTVEEAIDALVTKSANDAAAALGELLGGGSEDQFAQMMTLRARALGMQHTVFRNASGLPDPDQVTTAHDLAILARHLVQDFPIEYHYFSIPSFVFHGRVIPNHDHMLQTYPGADGIKTGYTEASGCNLVTSAARGEVRLIGVVLGAAHGSERDQQMAVLLDAGFQQMGVPVMPRNDPARLAVAAIASNAVATDVGRHASLRRAGPVRVAAHHPSLARSARVVAAHAVLPHTAHVKAPGKTLPGKLLHPTTLRRHADLHARTVTG